MRCSLLELSSSSRVVGDSWVEVCGVVETTDGVSVIYGFDGDGYAAEVLSMMCSKFVDAVLTAIGLGLEVRDVWNSVDFGEFGISEGDVLAADLPILGSDYFRRHIALMIHGSSSGDEVSSVVGRFRKSVKMFRPSELRVSMVGKNG